VADHPITYEVGDLPGRNAVSNINYQRFPIGFNHHNSCSWPGYADDFGQGLPGIFEMLENPIRSTAVENVLTESQVMHIPFVYLSSWLNASS
jgi:hypothetical protein